MSLPKSCSAVDEIIGCIHGMMYNTPFGKLLNGNSPAEVLAELFRQARNDAHLSRTDYLQTLTQVNGFCGTDYHTNDDDESTLGLLITVGYLEPI